MKSPIVRTSKKRAPLDVWMRELAADLPPARLELTDAEVAEMAREICSGACKCCGKRHLP